MGKPKMLLPWGQTTILGHVIETLLHSGLNRIVVVTGGDKELVDLLASQFGAVSVYNEDYENGEMLSSIQCGLRHIIKFFNNVNTDIARENALVCLGDQPQIREDVVRLILDRLSSNGTELIVPSYSMHRGHPWLISSRYWNEILEMKYPQTARDFLNMHNNEIDYVNVTDPSTISDVDTPEDYLNSRP